jgi:nucleotide-binding universal stress UspA family protein
VLAHAMESRSRANWRRAVDPLNWLIRKAEANSYLDELTRRLRTAGLLAEQQILEGPAAEQIVEFSRANHVPLIVLSSHGQSGLSGWNVSSIVQKIILRAHTSVMIIRAYQSPAPDMTGLRYHRLLVPMDGSQRAESILPVVATLARNQDAQILLAHVVRRPEVPRQMPPAREETELADRLVELNHAEATRYLDDLRSRLPADAQARVLISEHIAATLHELVDQENIDLVLLSAHGHSGLTRWPYGNVVMSFITFGTTPLLILQDLPMDQIEPTQAEITAREYGRS